MSWQDDLLFTHSLVIYTMSNTTVQQEKKQIIISLVNKPYEISPLEEVLKYQNANIIYRFRKLYDISEEEALDLFDETKKWLWISAVSLELKRVGKIDFLLGIINGLLIIDEMWHNFILHTMAYPHFCDHYFGAYIHHVPDSLQNSQSKKQKSPEEVKAAIDARYQQQYSFTYDLLGEETCLKWYKTFPEKYSKEVINQIKKPY